MIFSDFFWKPEKHQTGGWFFKTFQNKHERLLSWDMLGYRNMNCQDAKGNAWRVPQISKRFATGIIDIALYKCHFGDS